MDKTKKNQIVCEIFNSVSHGIGALLGIIFLVFMIFKFSKIVSPAKLTGFIVYGICFILMFLASCLYHGITVPKAKQILRIFDHSSIFLFIAGSYTPVILFSLEGLQRNIFLIAIWTIALAGTIFKIISYKKYDKFIKLSVLIYILMGWMAIFMIKPLIINTNIKFLSLIVLGGLLYTAGTYFYKKKFPFYNHVIWHIFVLCAAVCQFIGIYEYLV